MGFDPKFFSQTGFVNDKQYISCIDGSNAFTLNPKPERYFWTRWFFKIIHAFNNKNERISAVRELFNNCFNKFIESPPRCTREQEITFYINCAQFNRVIAKHNQSFLTWLFRDRVSQIGAKDDKFADFETRLHVDVLKATQNLSNMDKLSVKERLARLFDARILLDDTLRLRTFEKFEKLRSDLETAYTKYAAEFAEQKLSANTEQLDFKYIADLKENRSTLYLLFPDLTSVLDGILKEIDTSLREVNVLENLIRAGKPLADDLLQATLNDKYVPASAKESLKAQYAEYKWKTEFKALEKEMQGTVSPDRAPQIKARLVELKEKPYAVLPEGLIAQIDSYIGGLDEAARLQKLREQYDSLEKTLTDLEKRVTLAEAAAATSIHPPAQVSQPEPAVDPKKLEIEQGCARWKDELTRLSSVFNTTSNPADLPESFDRKEFDAFIATVPEGDVKAALVKQANEFKALVNDGNYYKQIAQKAADFVKKFQEPSYFPTQEDQQAIAALAQEYKGIFSAQFQDQMKLVENAFHKVVGKLYLPISDWLEELDGKIQTETKSFAELYKLRSQYEQYKQELEKFRPLFNLHDESKTAQFIRGLRAVYPHDTLRYPSYHDKGNKYITNFFTAYETFLEDKERYAALQVNGGASATKYKHGKDKDGKDKERPELIKSFPQTKETIEYEWLIFNETVRCDYEPNLHKWAADVEAAQANERALWDEWNRLNLELEQLDFSRPDKYNKKNPQMPQYKALRDILTKGYDRLYGLSKSQFLRQ